MKVFIDLGACAGDSIKLFRAGKIVKRDDLSEFKVIGFEAAPWCRKPEIINKAVGTYDGKVKLAFNKSRRLASTIESDNSLFTNGIKPFHPKRPTPRPNNVQIREVEIIDFSKWLKDNFTKDDYIILKLDIEGTEFPILEKMIKDNTLELINEVFCEFHSFHLGEEYKLKEEFIKSKFKELGIKFIDWELYD